MRFSTITATLAVVGHVLAQHEPIDQSTFNDILLYTNFARAAYAESCPSPPNNSVIVQTISNTTTGAHATLFRRDDAQELIMAFRGTVSSQNLATDHDAKLTSLDFEGSTCTNCLVHHGFFNLFLSIFDPVLYAIAGELELTEYTVIVTGHGLGAALASMSVTPLWIRGIPIQFVYTYGEPRNGDGTFAGYLSEFVPNERYFRVTHANDGVPSLPGTAKGYRHHGIEYWQEELGFGNTVNTTVECPPVNGTENQSCNLAQPFTHPVDRAHFTYSNGYIGNTTHVAACGES